MPYTKGQLSDDVERLLKSMAKELENRAECEKCDGDDVYISGRDDLARNYARQVAELVGKKPGAVRVAAHRGLRTLAARLSATTDEAVTR